MTLKTSFSHGFTTLPFLFLLAVLTVAGLRLTIEAAAGIRCLTLSLKAAQYKQDQLDILLRPLSTNVTPIESGIHIINQPPQGWMTIVHRAPEVPLLPMETDAPPPIDIWCPPAKNKNQLSAHTCLLSELHGGKTIIVHGNLQRSKLTIDKGVELVLILGEADNLTILPKGPIPSVWTYNRGPHGSIVSARIPPSNRPSEQQILAIRKL